MIDKFLNSEWLTRHGPKLGLAAAALSSALVVGIAFGASAAFGETLIVKYDLGGDIKDRMRMVDHMIRNGDSVEIQGRCISACTIYLAVPNACTTRGAEWGFHGPAARRQGLGLLLPEFEWLSVAMARYYPEPVRRWYLSTARHVSGQDYYSVSGAALIDMDAINECGKGE